MNEDENKLQEYHFQAYRNLVKCLIVLNSAGVAASIAYIGIILSRHDPNVNHAAHIMYNYLTSSLEYFIVGTAFILFEVVVEYMSYFFYKSEKDSQCVRNIFTVLQFALIILSLGCLVIAAYKGFILPFK